MAGGPNGDPEDTDAAPYAKYDVYGRIGMFSAVNGTLMIEVTDEKTEGNVDYVKVKATLDVRAGANRYQESVETDWVEYDESVTIASLLFEYGDASVIGPERIRVKNTWVNTTSYSVSFLEQSAKVYIGANGMVYRIVTTVAAVDAMPGLTWLSGITLTCDLSDTNMV